MSSAWCKGSGKRRKLDLDEQIARMVVCPYCNRHLAVRFSERTGEATLPRHKTETPKR